MDQLDNTKTNQVFFSLTTFQTNLSGNILLGISQLGHGKSPADGIGGSIKESCNRAVTRGDNVHCVRDMTSAKTKVFAITEDDPNEINPLIPTDLKAVPKTTKVHQVVWTN